MGNTLEFGSVVMFRVSGQVHGGCMQERWVPGVWFGKKLHTDEHLVLKGDGLVARSRALRETEQKLTKDMLDKLKSTPHDPTGVLRVSAREPLPVV